MKRKVLSLVLISGVSYLALTGYGVGPYQGGAGNRTGSAGSTANCSTGGCHAANTTKTTVVFGLLDPANPLTPVTKYTPGKTYTVSMGGNNTSGLPKFGFQASCVKAAATSTQAGTFSIGTGTGIAVRNASGGLQLVEHTTPQTGITAGAYTKTFNWTAPPAGTGTVRFYITLNAVNGNSATNGDEPNNDDWDVPEATVSVENVTRDLHIKAYPNPAAATLHLDVAGAEPGSYSLAAVNLAGQVVAARNISVASGTNDVSLNVQDWAAGLYQLRLSKDGASQTIAVIKQ